MIVPSKSRISSDLRWVILTALVCVALIGLFYRGLIGKADSVLFSMQADGLKNYYTFLYHVRHDSTYLHFNGLNYPFGEHILYTGARPSLVIATQWLSRRLAGGKPIDLAVANLSLFVTLIPTGILLFLILRELNLPRTYALVVASGLTFLSPQVLRFAGHPNLGYAAVIPACWYLFIRFYRHPGWKWTALLALNSIFWVTVDPYYLFLCSALLAALWLIVILASWWRSEPWWKTAALHIPVQIVFPVLVSAVGLIATDHQLHARPPITDPSFYRSSLAAVFLPSYPTFPIDFPWFVRWGQPESEGIAYVGLAGLAALPLLCVRAVVLGKRRRVVRRRERSAVSVLWISLAAALLVLLYGFGFPFRLGLQSWFSHLGLLQQFRTVGRLGWIFYYVYTVAAFYVLYVFARSLRMRGFRRTGLFVLGACLVILYTEAYVQNRKMARFMDLGPSQLAALQTDSPQLEWTRHVDTSRYQAIIPLPYFHIGSESSFLRVGSESSVFNSLLASLETGLPLTADFLSRTPIEQARLSTGLFDGNPAVLDRFPNDKPLLILATKEELRPGERQILRGATRLFSNSLMTVAEIKLDDLRNLVVASGIGHQGSTVERPPTSR